MEERTIDLAEEIDAAKADAAKAEQQKMDYDKIALVRTLKNDLEIMTAKVNEAEFQRVNREASRDKGSADAEFCAEREALLRERVCELDDDLKSAKAEAAKAAIRIQNQSATRAEVETLAEKTSQHVQHVEQQNQEVKDELECAKADLANAQQRRIELTTRSLRRISTRTSIISTDCNIPQGSTQDTCDAEPDCIQLPELNDQEELLDQIEALQQRICCLKEEVERAKSDAANAEQQRIEYISASAKSDTMKELSSELSQLTLERARLNDEMDQLRGALNMALSRNAALEIAAACAGNNQGQADSQGSRRAKYASINVAGIESRALENLTSQKTELREKVSVQKGQLLDLVEKNTALHLSMQELQGEVRHLSRQLRSVMPDIEVMSADVEAVMSRMEKVVRDGGGTYMKLHQEQQLRDVATSVRKANTVQEGPHRSLSARPMTTPSFDPKIAPKTPSGTRDRMVSLQRPSTSSRAGGMPDSVVGAGNLKNTPLPPLSTEVNTVVYSKKQSFSRQTSARSDIDSRAQFPSARGAEQKETISPIAPRSATWQNGLTTDPKGSLILGGNGGMAVLGGITPKAK
jgi:hypothetical protein